MLCRRVVAQLKHSLGIANDATDTLPSGWTNGSKRQFVLVLDFHTPFDESAETSCPKSPTTAATHKHTHHTNNNRAHRSVHESPLRTSPPRSTQRPIQMTAPLPRADSSSTSSKPVPGRDTTRRGKRSRGTDILVWCASSLITTYRLQAHLTRGPKKKCCTTQDTLHSATNT